MKYRAIMLCLLLVCSTFFVLINIYPKTKAQNHLEDDSPMIFTTPTPDEFEFAVNSNDHAVIGIRPPNGANYDIEVYTDTTFSTLIESSAVIGDDIDFVALDRNAWAGLPNKGAIVSATTGMGDYRIEVENDLEDHSIIDTWSGSMNASLGGPVLGLGSSGSWDDFHVLCPTVLYDGTEYHMWYSGNDGGTDRIGYANSSDGITWIKFDSNPVLPSGPPSSWDDDLVYSSTVLYDGLKFHMWYSGFDGSNARIGYANSTDGITWIKSVVNPVIDLGSSGTWDDSHVLHPTVIFDGLTYHMWYSGNDGAIDRIGYANSSDGITWTKNGSNPVLDLGSPGSWEDTHVNEPSVLFDGMTYHMWYKGHDGQKRRIGYANSSDGITWTKYGLNPVLDLGSSNSWDDFHIFSPSVLYNGTEYHMWYSGSDGTNYRIGYANSSDGCNWTKLLNNVEIIDAFELSGATVGTLYSLSLTSSLAADLDMFLFDFIGDNAQSREEVYWSSENIGVDIDESIIFTATITGDYLLVITNRDGGNGPYTINITEIPILPDDTPVTDSGLLSNNWQFEVIGEDHAVVGIRPYIGEDFDIGAYTDTFTTLIESSVSIAYGVDFVVLNKTMWASPPNRGAKVTMGTSGYVIEMENDVDDHQIIDTWNGSMETSLGGPVLDLGPPNSWDDFYVFSPSLIYDGSIYHMWYAGYDDFNYRIGYANSTDGITWMKYWANPVLDLGSPGSWEDFHVLTPTVIYDGITYHMWYAGMDGSTDRIGYAYSSDGITWTKNISNPVIDLGPPGSWDDSDIYSSSAIFDGTTYHMWYTGSDGSNFRIGYATSLDGITWMRSASNPVIDLGAPGSWDDTHIAHPTVFHDGVTYHMWYSGNDGPNERIGYATSSDGITWTKHGANPLLDLGCPGSWDDWRVNEPEVLFDGATFHMWYKGHDGQNRRIGYATSPDGINWTKLPYNAEVLDAYEINGLIAGSFHAIDLEVPTNADLDMFIYNTTGGRDDAVASSNNVGFGINESINFTAPTTGDYLLVITNENMGSGNYSINPPSSLTIVCCPLLSGNVLVGETNVTVEQLTLSTNAHSVVVTTIQIGQFGTASDTDIGDVYLYYDVNNNSVLDDGIDILLDTKSFNNSTLTFTNLSLMVNSSTDVNLLIVLDVPLGAEVGDTLQLRLASNDYVFVNAPDDVSATNFPLNSNIITIVKPTVTVLGTPITSGDVFIGQKDVTIEQLTLTAEFDTATVTNINVNLIGTGEDGDIANISLYDDVNDNGILDPTDILLDTQTFIYGSLTLSPSSYSITPGIPRDLFIIFNISNNSTIGHTLGIVINTSEDITVSFPAIVSTDNFPIISSFIEIIGGSITGTVKDTDNNPIEDGLVQLLNSSGDIVATVMTNSTGAFNFENIYFDNYNINVTAEGYEYNDTTISLISSETPVMDVGIIELTAPPPPQVTTGNITGKIVNEGGNPIEGVIVQLIDNNRNIIATYTTNLTGDFKFISISFGTYNITAIADGYETNDTTNTTISSDIPIKDMGNIELIPIPEPPIITGKMTGRIVNEGEEPIEGGIVQLINTTGSIVATFTTNSTGVFDFTEIPFGTYNLTAFAEGYEDNDTVVVTISIGTPEVNIGNIELSPIPEPPITTGTITGKIVEEGGEAIKGAIVQLKNNTGIIIATYTTNSSGEFEFIDVPFETYNISVISEGYETNDTAFTSISLETPNTDVGIIALAKIIEPPAITIGTIEGYVYDPDSKPIQNAIVLLLDEEGNSTGLARLTDSIGHYEFGNVEFGNYSVEISHENYSTSNSREFMINVDNPRVYLISTLAPIPVEPPSPIEKEIFPWWTWRIIFLLIALIATLLFLFLLTRKKKSKGAVEEPKELSSIKPSAPSEIEPVKPSGKPLAAPPPSSMKDKEPPETISKQPSPPSEPQSTESSETSPPTN